jgi:hypothetical protein
MKAAETIMGPAKDEPYNDPDVQFGTIHNLPRPAFKAFRRLKNSPIPPTMTSHDIT